MSDISDEERQAKWSYKSSQKNSPSRFTVFVEISIPCDVAISREGWSHRVAKQYGISREAQIGDPVFDKKYYIDTYAPVFATTFLSDPYKRDAIDEIMKLGFDSVELTESSIKAIKSPASFENAEAKDSLATLVAPHVLRLSENIPMASQAEILAKQAALVRIVPIYAVPVILSIIGPIPIFFSMESYRPVSDMPLLTEALKYSAAALALYIWIAYFILRGTSSAGRHLLGVFFISLLGFMMTGWGAVMYSNGALDQNPHISRKAVVIHKYENHSSKSNAYYIQLKSWRPDLEMVELRIGESLFNNVKPNETFIIVVTGPGWLGHEWIVSYAVARE